MSKRSDVSNAAQGALAMLPLSIAVIPWGLLAGSFAIEAGLTVWESQALSAVLFAGAAQLAAVGMFKAGVGITTMLLTVLFITSRHFLYSVSMRRHIAPLSVKWRLILGFLLTDELFAVVGNQSAKRFEPWYAFGAGFSFYLCWNLASLVGIIAGNAIPHLNEMGLEFAVAATFIAIVIPTIKNFAILSTTLTAMVGSVVLAYFDVEGGLMIASIVAMAVGFCLDKEGQEKEEGHSS